MNKKEKNFILNLAREIGKVQLKHFLLTKDLEISTKSKYFNDIITKVDIIAEKLLLEKTEKFGFSGTILTEETGIKKLGDSNKKIIVDPLDGTFFYSRKINNFCVAIAFEESNETVFSVVYNPATKEFFYAEKSKGAFLNGEKIQVSSTNHLKKSTILFSVYPNYKLEKTTRIFVNLMKTGGLRFLTHLFNMNLCYVACGKFDGIIVFYKKLPEWDKIPGILILEEAGGLATNFDGKRWSRNDTKIIASNGILHKQLLKIVSN
ncbi:MAG: inositol monophosphatase [Candidatus Aenigmatarchaeota archaeon]